MLNQSEFNQVLQRLVSAWHRGDFAIALAEIDAVLLEGLESFLGGPGLLWFLLFVVAGSVQYFFIGYLIDKLLQRRREIKAKRN
jgi:hypothetical protein